MYVYLLYVYWESSNMELILQRDKITGKFFPLKQIV